MYKLEYIKIHKNHDKAHEIVENGNFGIRTNIKIMTQREQRGLKTIKYEHSPEGK